MFAAFRSRHIGDGVGFEETVDFGDELEEVAEGEEGAVEGPGSDALCKGRGFLTVGERFEFGETVEGRLLYAVQEAEAVFQAGQEFGLVRKKGKDG